MRFFAETSDTSVPEPTDYPWVQLSRDNWDDYGYRTKFYTTLHRSPDDYFPLGSVKILKLNQTGGPTEIPSGVFSELSSEYCSLGGDLDYYETVFKLGKSFFRPYLKGLKDVAFDDNIRARFEEQEGFKVSLLRGSSRAERTIADAAQLFKKNRIAVKDRGRGFTVKFKTTTSEISEPLTISFNFHRKGGLPHRINVLIGYNGTGKTCLLSNLAIVASGYGYTNRQELLSANAGRFIGTASPFKKVIVISYSAFDTFAIPGRSHVERQKLEEDGQIQGYVYCGLREFTSEQYLHGDNQYRLKTPAELEDTFVDAMQRVREAAREGAFLDFLVPILEDASFEQIGLSRIYAETQNERILSLYRGLSSGHKIALIIIAQLTAHLDEQQPTLVLIDEPETHLHPPLLAGLLKSIRASLDRFNAYAIIATHSPVVLQETPSKYVHILRRLANRSIVSKPRIETFGENIGVITQEAFNLNEGSTDWHSTLRELARKKSLDEIEKLFDGNLGFGPRSYVESVKDDDDTE